MKTKRCLLIIFLAFLCMQGNAHTEAAPTLWKDFGVINKPVIYHETYNTSYAANRYGNSNNDVFFTFIVHRTTIFTMNFNGSPLEDISAHLLYSPLDADKYKNVGEPIPLDYDKFSERVPIINEMNLLLEEKIHHGWIGTLFIQVLKPGKYVLHCEAGQSCKDGYIRSNIYINPIGTSEEQPKYIGFSKENYNFDYSAMFEGETSGKFFSEMSFSKDMNINISSKGTQTDGLTIQVRDKASGRVIANSSNFTEGTNSYVRIYNVRMNAGRYRVEFDYTGKTELKFNLSGELSGYLPGDLIENSIPIPVTSDETDYQKTFDTRDYTNQYQGRKTSDIYHRLVVKNKMDMLITCPRCEIEGGAVITVINDRNTIMGTLYTNTEDQLELPGLREGTYYIISEGNTQDGAMTLHVQGNPTCIYAPSTERNYIKTVTPLIPTATSILLNNPRKAQQQVNYYDFLGRPEQTVNYGAIHQMTYDVVSYTEYDGLGRPSRNWLPVLSSFSAAYVSPKVFKSRSSFYYRDTCSFEKNIYEPSSLNRIIEHYGPGKEWHNSGHSEKMGYRCNVNADSCLNFAVEGGRGAPTLRLHGMYPTNQLDVLSTEDEDGHTGYKFADKKGHTVLERAMEGEDRHDTYYVFDDYGNLTFVLPPLAADSIAKSSDGTDNSQAILDKYAYQYFYDYRNRCIGKKLPGCEPMAQVYDCYDRLPFTQDGEQRKRHEWSVTLTDIFGRTVITGIYKGEIDRKDCSPVHIAAIFNPNSTGSYYGYELGLPEGFNMDSLKPSQINYYDTYEMMETTPELNYQEDGNYGKRYVNAQSPQHCKGLLTGSITFTVGTEDAFFSAYYYDYYRNQIQERRISESGKELTLKSAFNFSGNPTATCEEYNGGDVRLQKSYEYDHTGKVIEEVHSVNGQDSTHFKYDYEISGKIAQINRTHKGYTSYTYNSYNIRNWLTNSGSDGFDQKLHYTDGTGIPCYNGNISSMTWITDNLTRGYTFTYDGLSRLKDAEYAEGTSLSDNLHRFDEQVTGYDKMGNILGLKRYGQTTPSTFEQTAPSTFGLIDDLSLSYNGNQLQAVNDNAPSSAFENGFEFRDGADQPVEYLYDSNGNLTKDLNKKITDIQYNYLNLPSRIQFESGNSISYLYDANGSKLHTTHVMDGDTLNTDYWGNAIYENGVLDKLMTGQGYITLADTTYHYFLQDHQGNNRVIINQDGAVEEVNHYYPFGGMFASTQSVQPFKYNGKELDRRNGLDWYDYGARHYDAALGRWHAMDLLSEMYFSNSPYLYCGGNAVNYIDPYGMDYWSTNDPNEIERFMDALRFNNNSISEHFNFDSWTHVTDEEFTGNLTFSDNTNTFYSSYGTVENGVPTRVGISVKATNVWDGGATIDGGRGRWLRKSSGRMENTYPEFDLILLGRGLVNLVSNAAKTTSKELFNFGTSAAEHMAEKGRAVPIQILQQAIKGSKGVIDPQGSRALMHTTKMWKNGKLYNLEVLYDKATNSIWHFKYKP